MALLETFGGKLEKIRLQKLLLLLSKEQNRPSFHFIPYKFGCFSLSANLDLTVMANKGLVIGSETFWEKKDTSIYYSTLTEFDRNIIRHLNFSFENFSQSELIHYTYSKYPFYAINSKIAQDILSPVELAELKSYKPTQTGVILYTIGYEGISIEEYFNKLIINDVKVLCDVRNNPQSMKFGFSKNQLQKICDGLGIFYFHIPELGIKSEERRNLNVQLDYDKLFEKYRLTDLPKTIDFQKKVLLLLRDYQRIALTCFEKDICQCHRKPLSESIAQLDDRHYEIRHL